MALLGNYSVLHKSPGKFMSGQTASGDRANWNKPGMMRSMGAQTGLDWSRVAIPQGFYAGGAWMLPRKAGAMVLRDISTGTLSFANLAGGLNGTANLTGLGIIAGAGLVPIIQAVAALTGTGALTGDITGKLEALATLAGTGTISAAQLNSILNAAAALAGSGVLTADIVGKLDAAASLAGIGEITTADANMIVLASALLVGAGALSASVIGAWFMQSNLSGSGVAVAAISAPAHVAALLAGNGTLIATPYAKGDMAALIVVSATEELTTSAIANAVWAALAASNNSAGSMGEMLNDIATAGGSLTLEQTAQLREIFLVLGLDPAKPLTVTPSRRYVGAALTPEIDQTIAGNARTLSTVTRLP